MPPIIKDNVPCLKNQSFQHAVQYNMTVWSTLSNFTTNNQLTNTELTNDTATSNGNAGHRDCVPQFAFEHATIGLL